MLRDVFYFNKKPNVHPRERHADNLAHARQLCTTEHFWVINEFCDYRNFDWDWDFEYLQDGDVWAQEHNNVWPSVHQKDSGTWLCYSEHSGVIIYRGDVTPLSRKNEENLHWVVKENIDKSKFDFSWHPDPTDPPYIYAWGNKWIPVTLSTSLEYHVPGATDYKFMPTEIELLPETDRWVEIQPIDKKSFDFSWRPDPTSPPYIYVWGNKWIPGQLQSSLEYHVPGATERSYMTRLVVVQPETDRWNEVQLIDRGSFDFSWRPDPTSPPYIYVWGNKWVPGELQATLEYHTPGATDRKYMPQTIRVLPETDRWVEIQPIDKKSFDFSWRPDPTSPPYIYVWGNSQYPAEIMSTLEYHTPGATSKKYMEYPKPLLLQQPAKFEFFEEVEEFDTAWVPDPTSPPYIYVWGNQWNPAVNKSSVQYTVEGATEYKYMTVRTKRKVCLTNWQQPYEDDTFDLSWEPNPKDPPYLYQFSTQWQKTGGPKYIVPGASEVKYVDLPSKRPTNATDPNWKTLIAVKDFDYSWHPDETEQPYIYVFGNQWNKAELEPTVEYHVPGATERKYISDVIATAAATNDNWKNVEDVATFDYSWRPNPKDPAYIYVFGNTQYPGTIMPSVEYRAPGGTQQKFVDDLVATLAQKPELFNAIIKIDSFDYSWRPNPKDPAYIYVFGNQWNNAELEPTVEFRVEGATDCKYVNDLVAQAAPTDSWEIVEEVSSFDFSWRPNPKDPAYIYVFGNTQYPGTIMPTVRMIVPGATQEKFIDDLVATLAQKPGLFVNTQLIKEFDYSWRPDPTSPPYIYQFGTQWAKTHGPRFVGRGATETKFIDICSVILPDMTHWTIGENIDIATFDFSWHPDETSPAYIYQFGTILDEKDGPTYHTPGNNGVVVHIERTEIILEDLVFPKYQIKTTLEDLINEHPGEIFWALNPDLDYAEFDFKWVPDRQNVYHVNAFGSQDSINTQTYFVNGKMWQKGYRDINYVEGKSVDLRTTIDMFFIDRGNKESAERFVALKLRYNNIQKTRYLNTWVDTISRCVNKASSSLCWVLNSELDYSTFDFDFYPSPWQLKMVHVFGTQWSHWGTTFMVNTTTFVEDTKYIKIIEHLSNLNFVKRKTAVATNRLYDIVMIDHGNEVPEEIAENVTHILYKDSYFNTFKELLTLLPEKKEHYVWVCSSVCDYSGFDFSYICDPFAKDQLHVFPSDKQKFGDTFLIDVNKLRTLIGEMTDLEDYVKINFNQHQQVKRLLAPVVTVNNDSHAGEINYDFGFPYAVFETERLDVVDQEPMNLWTADSKSIIITSTGGTRLIVPKEAKEYVHGELYDYPYIKKATKLVKSHPLDIVFLSNGETGADANFEHLLKVTKSMPNRVVRVDGVNGRVAAYHASASASETPWAFTVFAKLKVDTKFDWSWQPDRLQIAKHYIFNATNPVNGLVYGHQAMIAYNKKLVLGNTGHGLDFTLDDEHEVVEMNSGIAYYNTDEFSTWRTAFREAIKLHAAGDTDSKERLDAWLNKGVGNFAQYSLDGARHAVEYSDEVNGDMSKLRLSYDWAWLRERFYLLYPNLVDKR